MSLAATAFASGAAVDASRSRVDLGSRALICHTIRRLECLSQQGLALEVTWGLCYKG